MKRLGIAAVAVSTTLAAVVAALAVSGAFGGGTTADDSAARADPAPVTSVDSEPEAARDAGDGSESIGVRGDWHVAIYNPDGSLDEEHTFRNALRPQGGDALGLVFANRFFRLPAEPDLSDYRWAIVFGELDTPNPSAPPSPGVGPCSVDISNEGVSLGGLHIGGSANEGFSPVRGRNFLLTSGCALWWPGLLEMTLPSGQLITLPTSGPLEPAEAIAGGVRLTGTVVAGQDGFIDYVETWLEGFDVETSPDFDFEIYALTGTGVGPFEVQAGQTINMTVEITFTTAP